MFNEYEQSIAEARMERYIEKVEDENTRLRQRVSDLEALVAYLNTQNNPMEVVYGK